MPFTPQDRLKGAKASLTVRRQKQTERRKKVKALYDTGMSKYKIAKTLGVNYDTIVADVAAIEKATE